MKRLLVSMSAAVLLFTTLVCADSIRLNSGRVVDCVVLTETNDQVTVRRGYSVLNYPRVMVASVTRTPVVTAKNAGPTTRNADTRTNGSAGRFPIWSNVIGFLAQQPWGKDLRQIPATYVDNGVQKDVPYQSFACANDYEVNIYGDPDDPACIEIGIYRGLLNDDAAKTRCVEMIATLLPNAADGAIARALNRSKDLIARDELTIEVTPPDAPDAYGGWWISIYDEAKLDKSRASKAELDQVTVAVTTPKPAAPPASATPTPKLTVAASMTGDESDTDWTPSDITRRRTRPSSSGSAATATSSGGRVNVRGYTRKDGTYVRPHTRSR